MLSRPRSQIPELQSTTGTFFCGGILLRPQRCKTAVGHSGSPVSTGLSECMLSHDCLDDLSYAIVDEPGSTPKITVGGSPEPGWPPERAASGVGTDCILFSRYLTEWSTPTQAPGASPGPPDDCYGHTKPKVGHKKTTGKPSVSSLPARRPSGPSTKNSRSESGCSPHLVFDPARSCDRRPRPSRAAAEQPLLAHLHAPTDEPSWAAMQRASASTTRPPWRSPPPDAVRGVQGAPCATLPQRPSLPHAAVIDAHGLAPTRPPPRDAIQTTLATRPPWRLPPP